MSANEANAAPQARGFRVALGIALAFVVVLLGTASVKGWGDLEAVRARESVLEGRVTDSVAEIERLERRLLLLRDDPATLERLAREELGMVRPGEKVIVLSERGGRSGGPETLLLDAVEVRVDEQREPID